MYKNKNVFLKIVMGIVIFLILLAPFITTALSDVITVKEKKSIESVTKSPKVNGRLNFIDKIANIKESIEDDITQINVRIAEIGDNPQSGQEVTFTVNDDVLYRVLIDNYGAQPIQNAKEVKMLNNFVVFEYRGTSTDRISDLTGLRNLTCIERIVLNQNDIKSISELNYLTNLKYIEIQSNKTAISVPDLSGLALLETLDLSRTTLTNTENLASLKNSNLKNLILKNCGVTDAGFVSNFNKIEKLDLESNNINNIRDIVGLTTLKELNLGSNTSITSIKDIGSLNNLESLDLSYDKLIQDWSYLTEQTEDYSAYKLIGLKKLNLSNVNQNYSNINVSSVSMFTNLEDLNLSGNFLTDMYGVLQLKQLKALDLSNNSITTIEPLVNLVYSDYEAKIIDMDQSEFSKIEDLRLNSNQIEEIDTLQYMSDTITHLELRDNKITYTWIINGLYKLSKNELYLQSQRSDHAILLKENTSVEQKVILDDLIQRCKDPNNIIYEEGANFAIEGPVTLNNEDYTIPGQPKSNYNKNGYYNIIFPENVEEGAKVTITITGGRADGSVITYTIRRGVAEKVYDTIVCEDYNLFQKIMTNINKISKETGTEIKYGYIPYIIMIDSSYYYNITKLELDGKNENADGKIKSVKGLESFLNLETLILSTNSISSNNDESKINYIKDIPSLKTLILSENKLQNADVISNSKYLESVDLSGNEITDISAFTDWVKMLQDSYLSMNLRYLNLSGNNISDLTPISTITTLTTLNLGSNNIVDLAPIKDFTELTSLDISANKIEDIQYVAGFTKLTSLLMENNMIKDLSYISDLTLLQHLNISNNKIDTLKDISRMYSLIDLKANKNRIKTIKDIEGLNNLRGKVELAEQNIFHGLDGTQTGKVTISLPAVFAESKQDNILEKNNHDFKFLNCVDKGDGTVEVDTNELGNRIATVEIIDGSLAGTRFSIGKEATYNVEYSTKNITKEDVTVTVSFSDPSVRIINNEGSKTYTYTSNGSFTFEYENDLGLTGEIPTTVTWIDKEAPVISGVENGGSYATEATPVITDQNLKTIELKKDGVLVEIFESGMKLTEEGAYVLTAEDEAGNKTTISFGIGNTVVPPIDDLTVTFKNMVEETENGIVYVSNIQPKVDATAFKGNIETNGEISIQADDETHSVISSGYVATGYKVIVTKGETTKEYVIVVKGDANGDGDANFNDILQVNKHRLHKITLTGAFVKAGDVTGDKVADFKDILQINKFRLKKINEL